MKKVVIITSGLLFLTVNTWAATPQMPPKVEICSTCHGTGEAGTPSLAGENAVYLKHEIDSFKDGSRKNDDMAKVVPIIDPALEKEATEYYASIAAEKTKTDSNKEKKYQSVIAKKLIYKGDASRGLIACSVCHGATLNGVGTVFPRLAGRQDVYILNQFEAFKKGERKSDPNHQMADIVKHLTKKEMSALAEYASRMPVSAPEAMPMMKKMMTPAK